MCKGSAGGGWKRGPVPGDTVSGQAIEGVGAGQAGHVKSPSDLWLLFGT